MIKSKIKIMCTCAAVACCMNVYTMKEGQELIHKSKKITGVSTKADQKQFEYMDITILQKDDKEFISFLNQIIYFKDTALITYIAEAEAKSRNVLVSACALKASSDKDYIKICAIMSIVSAYHNLDILKDEKVLQMYNTIKEKAHNNIFHDALTFYFIGLMDKTKYENSVFTNFLIAISQ